MELEPPREPTEAEKKLLELLVSVDYPGVEAFREQIRTARVQTDCLCGCGSFAVFSDASTPSAVEYEYTTPAAIDRAALVDAFAFVRDGRLSNVEITYYLDETRGVPDATRLIFD